MKILFLDIDGVLNTDKSLSLLSISKPRLRRLKKIIEVTGCKLVLSSTWRRIPEGMNKLRKVGLTFVGLTPTLAGTDLVTGERKCRGHEIQAWLENHPEVTKYAIVDDIPDMLEEQIPFYVQTYMETGLTEDDMNRLIELLR